MKDRDKSEMQIFFRQSNWHVKKQWYKNNINFKYIFEYSIETIILERIHVKERKF